MSGGKVKEGQGNNMESRAALVGAWGPSPQETDAFSLSACRPNSYAFRCSFKMHCNGLSVTTPSLTADIAPHP